MRRSAISVALVLVMFGATGCSKGAASGADAADAPPASDAPSPADKPADAPVDVIPTDAPAPTDTPAPSDAKTDAPSTDAPAGQCPAELPVDAAACSYPNLTCSYASSCGQRDFLCFAFEVGAPAKWICLTNCACDGGGD